VTIAVVIPALDEADRIVETVASARGPEVEVVVVDGGSRDATVERARTAGAEVVAGPRGRARQLAAGVRSSRGDPVVFLHADTKLPAGWGEAVRAALADPGVAGGAFRLRFEETSPGLRVIEWGARLRAAWAGLPYGDQALFLRRAALDSMGGVPDVPIFEDLDLARGMRRSGRLALLPLPAVTSARRYRARGVARTWLRNALALAAWRLGSDRERVAAWYRR
jgi:hypothetical protein